MSTTHTSHTSRKNIMKFEPNEELFGYNSDSQFLIWMKPSEFLDKASKIQHTTSHYQQTIVKKLVDKMKEDKPIDPLFLDIDTVNCVVTDHEGRHRAIAAEKVGIEKVPVIIYLKNDKGDYISAKDYMKQVTKDKTVNKCNIFNAIQQGLE